MNFGVSFSVKQCRNFGIDPNECLVWLIKRGGFKRFRLMSYWNDIEKRPGVYDFSELDEQIKIISKNQGVISLCLGVRQPRWPENHWPDWAWKLSFEARTDALMKFIEVVIGRYKDNPVVVSYQLENEALLKNFGERPEIDRKRLRAEFDLVKKIDPSRDIVMTTSTSWGIPLRRPIGDIIGFSYYQVVYNNRKKAYTDTFHRPWINRSRAYIIKSILRRQSFIHELQLEPWGPRAIWEMPYEEQLESMNPETIKNIINSAKRTNLYPVDLWGGEWWYWSSKNGHDEVIDSVFSSINNPSG